MKHDKQKSDNAWKQSKRVYNPPPSGPPVLRGKGMIAHTATVANIRKENGVFRIEPQVYACGEGLQEAAKDGRFTFVCC